MGFFHPQQTGIEKHLVLNCKVQQGNKAITRDQKMCMCKRLVKEAFPQFNYLLGFPFQFVNKEHSSAVSRDSR